MPRSTPAAAERVVVPTVSDALLARYDVAAPRYTSYPTVPDWSDAFGPADFAAALTAAGRDAPDAPLSLYVHVPFCWSLCDFCGCNVVVSHDQSRADAYLDHLALEIERVSALLGPRRRVSQLHWGGGTPTFLTEAQSRRLWDLIASRFELLPNAEASIEANPAVTPVDQIAALRALGFNRISFGVQDLDPDVQSMIGRAQTPEQTRLFVDAARAAGFESVNLDLIYGLPGQDTRRWARTLEQVCELRPDRLAVYSFAYVPHLRPNQRNLPADALPTGRAKLDLFRQAWQTLSNEGYAAIGFDHFAAPDDELAVAAGRGTLGRNFQGYTVQQAPDSVAFGVTGISDIGGVFAQNAHRVGAYQRAVAAGGLATVRGLDPEPEDRHRRRLITDLMCTLALDLGPDPAARYPDAWPGLLDLAADGLVELDGSHLRVTPLGRLFLRCVALPFDRHRRAPPPQNPDALTVIEARPERAQFSRSI